LTAGAGRRTNLRRAICFHSDHQGKEVVRDLE
jgi:hypothetical protein